MKILHISRTMGQGGAEKIVYQLCSSDNTKKKVVASTGGNYVDELQKIGVPHYEILDIDKKNPFLMLKTLVILIKIVKKEKIDIIHTHHRMAAFYARIIKVLFPKVKLIYTAHNIFTNKKMLLQFSLKTTKIIAVGKGVKDNLVNYYKIDSKNIEIIYNSIKPNKTNNNIEMLKKLNKKTLIGNIGRLSEQKGMDVFIKAMKPIIDKNDNIYGIIVGNGEDMNDLKQLTNSLNIEKNIIFLGYQNNVFDVLKDLNFIVLSSRWEGFPLTPIEAFSMKKTVIASNIPGNNEIVIDEYNGMLFEKNNEVELAKQINKLINDKELLNYLENNALKYYQDNFSYKIFEKKYKEMYENI